jgi:hypothetical protein
MYTPLENQFIYPSPKGSKLIFFAPLGVGVNEENQFPNKREKSYIKDAKARSIQVIFWDNEHKLQDALYIEGTFLHH